VLEIRKMRVTVSVLPEIRDDALRVDDRRVVGGDGRRRCRRGLSLGGRGAGVDVPLGLDRDDAERRGVDRLGERRLLGLRLLRHLCQAPILIGIFQCHGSSGSMHPFNIFPSVRHIPPFLIIFHATGISCLAMFITGMVANTSHKSIFPQTFISQFRIIITNSFIISRSKKRNSRITNHHIRIISS
jgi:hypothetical protein